MGRNFPGQRCTMSGLQRALAQWESPGAEMGHRGLVGGLWTGSLQVLFGGEAFRHWYRQEAPAAGRPSGVGAGRKPTWHQFLCQEDSGNVIARLQGHQE